MRGRLLSIDTRKVRDPDAHHNLGVFADQPSCRRHYVRRGTGDLYAPDGSLVGSRPGWTVGRNAHMHRYFILEDVHLPHNRKAWARAVRHNPEGVRQAIRQHGSLYQADVEYAFRQWRRAEDFHDGKWGYCGIGAVARVRLPNGVIRVLDSWVWGVEDDADTTYLELLARDEARQLRPGLRELGVTDREIDRAVRDVVIVDSDGREKDDEDRPGDPEPVLDPDLEGLRQEVAAELFRQWWKGGEGDPPGRLVLADYLDAHGDREGDGEPLRQPGSPVFTAQSDFQWNVDCPSRVSITAYWQPSGAILPEYVGRCEVGLLFDQANDLALVINHQPHDPRPSRYIPQAHDLPEWLAEGVGSPVN